MFGAIKHSFGRKLICEFNLIDIIYLTLHIAKDIYPYFYQPLLCLPSFLLLMCCGVVACSLCFKIIVFKTFFQEHCPSVKQLRSRSGPKLLLVISAEHRHSVDPDLCPSCLYVSSRQVADSMERDNKRICVFVKFHMSLNYIDAKRYTFDRLFHCFLYYSYVNYFSFLCSTSACLSDVIKKVKFKRDLSYL